MRTRPPAAAFDVLETLLDVQPLHDRFVVIGQPTICSDSCSAFSGTAWPLRALRLEVGTEA